MVDVDSYNVDVWDSDESKSSGYNVGIFDDVDVDHAMIRSHQHIKARGISWSML